MSAITVLCSGLGHRY